MNAFDAIAELVECLDCGAAPSDRCRTISGRVTTAHLARVRRTQKAQDLVRHELHEYAAACFWLAEKYPDRIPRNSYAEEQMAADYLERATA